MPLHPQAVEFLEYAAAAGQPKLYALTPAEARAQVDGAANLIGAGPELDSVHDVAIPVTDGDITARVYRPEESRGTVVWFHGGLWVFGGLESHDAMCRRLANSSACTVVSVAYRLAPEHQFPVPLEDCWHALGWAANEYPSSPLVVGGDSAGGNLAAVCAARAHDRGEPELALQVLVYPMLDAAMDTASMVEHGENDLLLLGRRDVEWSYRHYLPDDTDRQLPEVSPLRAPDLAGVAPAVIVTDEYDPLRDEGLAYAARLRAAGVTVTERHYADMMHVFFQFVNVLERGNDAVEQVGIDIRHAVDRARQSSAERV